MSDVKGDDGKRLVQIDWEADVGGSMRALQRVDSTLPLPHQLFATRLEIFLELYSCLRAGCSLDCPSYRLCCAGESGRSRLNRSQKGGRVGSGAATV